MSYRFLQSADELGELVSADLAVLLTEHFQQWKGAGPVSGGLRMRPLPVPLTPIVGRETEIKAVTELFRRDDVRLVTITGPGGVGKTRLALACAQALAPSFPDGVGFVDLAAVSEERDVPATVATAVGVTFERPRPPDEVVVEVLEDRSVLLLLDNFEQVTGAGPFVAALLAACPRLQVLVTSRSPLHVRGEHRVTVSPLVLPAGEPTYNEILASPAVALFEQLGEQVRPGFAVTPANAAAVREICVRLDGLPLAIELIAPAVRLFPPDVLAGRLRAGMGAFAGDVDLPERQRTLEATLEWSYRLLDEQERRMLARLSVFVGGFTLDAVEAVCGGAVEPDPLQRLSGLLRWVR